MPTREQLAYELMMAAANAVKAEVEKSPIPTAVFDQLVALSRSETERGMVICMSAALDDALQAGLQALVRVKSLKKHVFSQYRPLGTASAREDVAVSFGWISEPVYRELGIFRRARNALAHGALDSKAVHDVLVDLLAKTERRLENVNGVDEVPLHLKVMVHGFGLLAAVAGEMATRPRAIENGLPPNVFGGPWEKQPSTVRDVYRVAATSILAIAPTLKTIGG